MADGNGVMGIIGCVMFEDEIVEVLAHDEDLCTVYIVKNEEGDSLAGKLTEKSEANTVFISEDEVGEVKGEGLSVIVWQKPMALHEHPDELRDDVYGSISEMTEVCEAILLFYGLCGNAFKELKNIKTDFDIPVVIIRDSTGEVIDDCIGAVLGGCQQYLDQLKKNTGTFFLTPMWAMNWREMLHKVRFMASLDDIEGAKYVFDNVGYHKAVKVDTGLGEEDEFDEKVDEFARTFDFTKETLEGDLSLIYESYNKAKELIQ